MGDVYKVHYFNSRGWAEPLRMILSYGGANWEDIRYPTTPPVSVLPPEIKAIAPYGQVPLLDFNGEIISQSTTITRFVARKFDLVGANELEATKCDEIVDALKDFGTLWIPLIREQDEAKREEMKKKATEDSKTRFLSKFNEIIEANGGYLVGKGLTWADIYAAYFIDNVNTLCQCQLVDEYPALKNLIETVFAIPSIKEWIEKRPVTLM